MLKRPSSRRKSNSDQVSLNLVPILDTMVCLIGFLLFTTSFLALVTIETPFPMASPKEQEQQLKEKPLQLTVSVREKETEIWSPFEKIPAKIIPNPTPGQPDVKALHEALLGIKQKFPQEARVVFAPASGVNYDTLIAVLDSIRTIEATDPPIFVKNAKTGVDEAIKALFPDILFGNLLGDDN